MWNKSPKIPGHQSQALLESWWPFFLTMTPWLHRKPHRRVTQLLGWWLWLHQGLWGRLRSRLDSHQRWQKGADLWPMGFYWMLFHRGQGARRVKNSESLIIVDTEWSWISLMGFYPLAISRGWLEFPRTTWRFIAGTFIELGSGLSHCHAWVPQGRWDYVGLQSSLNHPDSIEDPVGRRLVEFFHPENYWVDLRCFHSWPSYSHCVKIHTIDPWDDIGHRGTSLRSKAHQLPSFKSHLELDSESS